MVQEDGAKPIRLRRIAPNSRSSKANTGNKAADRLKQSKIGSHRTEKSLKRPSNHKHDSAWTERRAHLAKWSAVKASNSPDGRADKLNKDLV